MIRVAFNAALLVAFVSVYLVRDIFAATIVVMIGVTVEVVTTLAVRHRASRVQWIGLGLVLVLGAATLLFRDPTFIKWRPSGFYWICAATLISSRIAFGTNAIEAALRRWLRTSSARWAQIELVWICFLVFLGLANLIVAYQVSTRTWVLYRLFVAPGMIAMLTAVLAVWLRNDIRSSWNDRKRIGTTSDLT